MPYVSTPAGLVLLKDCWDGYEKGVDAARGPWVKKLYMVDDWGTTNDVINAMTGAGSFNVPVRCPEAPNLFCLVAQAVGLGEWEKFADDGTHFGGLPSWRKGMIEATFAIPPYQVSSDQPAPPSFPNETGEPYLFMEQSIDWTAEVQKIPDTSYQFQDDSTPVDVPCAVSLAVAEFVVVRKFQTILPYANIAAYLNRLNTATLFGQPKGLLKLKKVGSKRGFYSNDSFSQDTTYTFGWREVDHNMQFKPGTGDYEFIVNKKGDFPYKYADLSQVLL